MISGLRVGVTLFSNSSAIRDCSYVALDSLTQLVPVMLHIEGSPVTGRTTSASRQEATHNFDMGLLLI